MKYVVTTYQGINITVGEEFDFKTYMGQINKQEVNSVVLGAISTLKNNIRFVKPVYEEGETPVGDKLTLYLNSSTEPITAYCENYNSVEVSQQYNDRQTTFIVIGDTGIHRNEYSLVMPATAKTEQ